jgi:hypothetical protein
MQPDEQINYSDESTIVYANFAGRRRRFQLTIDGVGQLERICGAGIGAIMMRIGSHSFYSVDIWEPIRIGLEGGGMSEPEATALVTDYNNGPIRPYLPLAGLIVSAHVNGAPLEKKAGAESQEGKDGPAISPNSTQPAPPSDGHPRKLDA